MQLLSFCSNVAYHLENKPSIIKAKVQEMYTIELRNTIDASTRNHPTVGCGNMWKMNMKEM